MWWDWKMRGVGVHNIKFPKNQLKTMFKKRKAWQTLITSNQSQSVYQLERQWPLLAHMYVSNYERTEASNWEIFYKNSWPAIFKSDKIKEKMRELFHAERGRLKKQGNMQTELYWRLLLPVMRLTAQWTPPMLSAILSQCECPALITALSLCRTTLSV